ncbi:energy transducer TonB [Flavobacterium sp. XS2P14]|uniref:energy transducer TonB n=1 Tax=Flavobacterium sp. XS2P14 TaxID=3401735 RepID=UPI003AAE52B6
MERKYKIAIPEPCQEDWNKMTPNDQGRFCMSCAKTVIDFTAMLPEEVQHFFIQNQNQNICGRMKKSQLDSLTIQIPSRALYIQTQYHKMFLLALFISMGTTLFSCADKNGNKQKIDAVEVVEDTTKASQITLGMMLPEKNNTQNHVQPPGPATKVNHVKFKKTRAIECGKVTSKKEQETKNETNVIYEDNTVYGGMGISVYPDFKGGISKFYSFIKDNFKVSKNDKNLKGEIVASFIIEKDGNLKEVKIIKELGIKSSEELSRVLKSSPKWYPGEENGKKRNCVFQLSLTVVPDTIKKSFF